MRKENKRKLCNNILYSKRRQFISDHDKVDDRRRQSVWSTPPLVTLDVDAVFNKCRVVDELLTSFYFVQLMRMHSSSSNSATPSNKSRSTPVYSNPRGLCSDRIAYRKYIHSVYEMEQMKMKTSKNEMLEPKNKEKMQNGENRNYHHHNHHHQPQKQQKRDDEEEFVKVKDVTTKVDTPSSSMKKSTIPIISNGPPKNLPKEGKTLPSVQPVAVTCALKKTGGQKYFPNLLIKSVDEKLSYSSTSSSSEASGKASNLEGVGKKENNAVSKLNKNVDSNSESKIEAKTNKKRVELVFDAETRMKFERDRQRAVKEQTVLLTRPLKRWILNDDKTGAQDVANKSDGASVYVEPKLRLETLRTTLSVSQQQFFRRGSVKRLSNSNSCNKKNKKNIVTNNDNMNNRFYNGNRVDVSHSPKEIFRPNGDLERDANNNTVKKQRVKNLWDQRIEEHEKWLENELKRPRHLHKSWKPSELLSASLLAVKDEEHHQPIVQYRPVAQGPSDPLFSQPINYLELANMRQSSNRETSNAEMVIRTIPAQPQTPYYPDGKDNRYYGTTNSFRNVSQTRNQWQQRVDENVGLAQQQQQQQQQQRQQAPVVFEYVSRPVVQQQQQQPQQQQPLVIRNGHGTQLSPQRPIIFNVEALQQQQQQQQPKNVDQPQWVSPSVYYEQKVSPSVEREIQLLMTYLHTHPQVTNGLGITIPSHMRQKFIPSPNTRVELLEVVQPEMQQPVVYYREENRPVQQQQQQQQVPANWSPRKVSIERLEPQIITTTPRSTGRYEKNINSASTPIFVQQNPVGQQPRYIPVEQQPQQQQLVGQQLRYIPVEKQPPPQQQQQQPEHGHQKKQWQLAQWTEPPPPINKTESLLDESQDTEKAVYRSPGESLIAKEIRELKEREAELQLSRSQLGLQQTNAQQSADDARTGGGQWEHYQEQQGGPAMRGAQSYDHLQAVVENGLQKSSENATEIQKVPLKAGSMDHLHYAVQNDFSYVPVQNESNYRPIQNESAYRPVEMVDTSNMMYTRGGPRALYEQFLTAHHPSSPERVRLVQAFTDLQQQQQATAAPAPPPQQQLPVVQALQMPTPQRRTPVPYTTIEARIEQEVAELKKREEELRRQRESLAVKPAHQSEPTNVVVEEPKYGNEELLTTINNSENIIRHREYVGQRNPSFKSSFSDIYELHRTDKPDEV